MRKIGWVLIIAYTLVMMKPVLPVVADAMAHTFWKSQHMLVVHEVNGKFHVHTEMAQSAKQTEKEKHTNSYKIDLQDCLHVSIPFATAAAATYAATTIKHGTFLCQYPFAEKLMDYPPPQAPVPDNRTNVS